MSRLKMVTWVDNQLPKTPFVREGGSLLMMVGLPGTGKSSVVQSLQSLITCSVISTDNVRLQIWPQPTYTPDGMAFVYDVCYGIIQRRLKRGQRVVFDASNYLAARREYLAALAQRSGAPITVCYVQASQAAINQRLLRRSRSGRTSEDLSDADWSVYKWMVEAQEPVAGEHLILDTTSTDSRVLAQRLHAYWLRIEQRAQGDPDLQSFSWASKLGRDHHLGG